MKPHTHGIIKDMKESDEKLETKNEHIMHNIKNAKDRRTSYQITDELASLLLVVLIIMCGVVWW